LLEALTFRSDALPPAVIERANMVVESIARVSAAAPCELHTRHV